MFEREYQHRMQRIEDDYPRARAEEEGRPWEDLSSLDYTMWREFIRSWRQDKRFRQRLFYPGVVLVVLGFVFQVLGSWPYGVFGIKSC